MLALVLWTSITTPCLTQASPLDSFQDIYLKSNTSDKLVFCASLYSLSADTYTKLTLKKEAPIQDGVYKVKLDLYRLHYLKDYYLRTTPSSTEDSFSTLFDSYINFSNEVLSSGDASEINNLSWLFKRCDSVYTLIHYSGSSTSQAKISKIVDSSITSRFKPLGY